MPKLVVRGVFVPVTTPFDVHGELSLQAFQGNLQKLLQHDIAGVVVAGSNGEAALLDEEERVRLWEAARAALPDGRLLIAGVGRESTRATIALARRAAEAGADAVLAVTPSYFHPFMSVEALTAHFRAVADASPVPVLIYVMPRLTHVDMNAAVVMELSRHINIIGIKDSSGDVGKIGQITQRVRSDFYVLSGAGGAFFPSLMMGASGGVLTLGNVAPAQTVELYCRHAAGDWSAARDLQARLTLVNTLITARLGPAGVKAAMDMLGYYGGPVRPPLLPIAENDRVMLRAALADAGLLKES